MSFDVAPGLLVAFLLALVRASCWVVVCPPFNNALIPKTVKAGLAAAIAVCVAPHLYPATQGPAALPVSNWSFLGSVLLQAFTGLALGFVTNILYNTVAAAGALIDIFGGFSISAAYDPMLLSQTTIMSRVYELLALMLLFATNGDLMVMHGFLESFRFAPLRGIDLHSLSQTLLSELGLFFQAALEIAGPLVAVLFLADVILGLLTKAAPQLNAFALGFPLKILITLLTVGLALPLLPGAVNSLVTDSINAVAHLIHAVG